LEKEKNKAPGKEGEPGALNPASMPYQGANNTGNKLIIAY